ncbi:MAG: ribonuclease R [Thermodesulfobacteriota bacterium]
MVKKKRSIPRVPKKKNNFLSSSELQALLNDIIIIAANSPKGVERKKIREILQLPPNYTTEINTALAYLCQQGVFCQNGKKRYKLDSTSVRRGTLSFHPRGFGFVSLESEAENGGMENDVFIPPRCMNHGIHGDQVLLQITKKRRKKTEGCILAILQRTTDKIIGVYEGGRIRGRVIPEDDRYPFHFIIPGEFSCGAKDGESVVIRLDPGENRKHHRQSPPYYGKIVEVLGDPEDLETQARVVIHKHGLVAGFADEVLAEAARLNKRIVSSGNRLDLRDILHVTIDAEDARDFDDAVAVVKTRKGYRLYVSIADVSHYVQPGSILDQEAYKRGTSVYLPGTVLPMLPEELSNDLCSLKPEENRYAFTVIMEFDRQGNLKKKEFHKSIICSHYRLTYNLVNQILVERLSDIQQQYKPILTPLKWMGELADALEAQRVVRGSLMMEIPEAVVEVDFEKNEISSIYRAERKKSHKMIEEFMLIANETVATILEKNNRPALYRIHERPDPQKVAELEGFLTALGFNLSSDTGSVNWFQNILDAARGSPLEYIVNNLILRVMQQARYSPHNTGHFALASSFYTHFTSPIRRYPDLQVHRVLSGLTETLPLNVDLAEAGEHVSQQERKAMEAEREMVGRLKALYMKDKTGQEFRARVSGIGSNRLFVELTDTVISGSVALGDLKGDYFLVDEKNHRLIGERTHRIYQIGDEVEVRLLRVDFTQQKIDFTII